MTQRRKELGCVLIAAMWREWDLNPGSLVPVRAPHCCCAASLCVLGTGTSLSFSSYNSLGITHFHKACPDASQAEGIPRVMFPYCLVPPSTRSPSHGGNAVLFVYCLHCWMLTTWAGGGDCALPNGRYLPFSMQQPEISRKNKTSFYHSPA